MNSWYHSVWQLFGRHFLVWNLRRWALLLCVDVNAYYLTIGFLCVQFSFDRGRLRALNEVDLDD